MITLTTERLILRTWTEDDIDPYFRINQDPKVIEFLRGPLTREQVANFIPAVNSHGEKHGYTLWATELKATGELIGYIGLNYTDWPAHFTPVPEIGWRLGSQYWGNGYATEGARAVLEYGFMICNLPEIVSFTVPANMRSRRVMEKIGLQRDAENDFAHPKLAVDHPLSHHVLYRLTRDAYLAQRVGDLNGTQLSGERIACKTLSLKYTQDVCKHFTANITEYMLSRGPKSKAALSEHIQEMTRKMALGEELALVILNKETEEFLGYVALHKIRTATPEMGIWLKEEAHGKGYGFEALSLVKKWAEETLSYQYLKYPVDRRNTPSRRIAEKLGGKPEAEYLKEGEGKVLDEIEYRIYKTPSR